MSRFFPEEAHLEARFTARDEPVSQSVEEAVELVRWTSATTDRRVIMDVPIPQIMEENVEVVANVFQDWISERIREQVVTVPVSRFRNTCSSSSLLQ